MFKNIAMLASNADKTSDGSIEIFRTPRYEAQWRHMHWSQLNTLLILSGSIYLVLYLYIRFPYGLNSKRILDIWLRGRVGLVGRVDRGLFSLLTLEKFIDRWWGGNIYPPDGEGLKPVEQSPTMLTTCSVFTPCSTVRADTSQGIAVMSAIER